MKKILGKSKNLHHRYKRYAAVLAGAAIMAGTTLPGMPISKVAASETPAPTPATTEERTVVNKDNQHPIKHVTADKTKLIKNLRYNQNNDWNEHLNGWPSSGDNQGWVENGRIYYRNDNAPSREYSYNLPSPVEFVKEYSSLYGFDSDNDTFTLLTQSHRSATVQVIKHDTGQRFKVDLENRHDWKITAIRGIGDTNHPATYYSTRTLSHY